MLRKLISLPAADQCLIIGIALMLPLLDVSLRVFGFKSVYRVLERFHLRKFITPSDIDGEIVHVSKRIRQISHRHLLQNRCLAQSLTLYWLLGNRGIKTDLRFGQRRQQGRFEAHAWLEYLGRPINENLSVYQRYYPFEQLIHPKSNAPL